MYKKFLVCQQNKEAEQGILVLCRVCEKIKYNLILNIMIKEVNGNR